MLFNCYGTCGFHTGHLKSRTRDIAVFSWNLMDPFIKDTLVKESLILLTNAVQQC